MPVLKLGFYGLGLYIKPKLVIVKWQICEGPMKLLKKKFIGVNPDIENEIDPY